MMAIHTTKFNVGKWERIPNAIGISHSQHLHLRIILEIIEKLTNASNANSASRTEVFSIEKIKGIEPKKKNKDEIDWFIQCGRIYEVHPEKYRLYKDYSLNTSKMH